MRARGQVGKDAAATSSDVWGNAVDRRGEREPGAIRAANSLGDRNRLFWVSA